jgi:hypothetical protein
MAKQLVRIAAMGVADCDADACTDINVLPIEMERLDQLSNSFARHDRGVIHMLQFAYNKRELIAAEASDGVRFAQASGESSRSLHEQAVTSRVAEGIVDVFKVIQV